MAGVRRTAREKKPRLWQPGDAHGTPLQRKIIAGKRAALAAQEISTEAIVYDRNARGQRTGLVFMRAVGGRFVNNPSDDVGAWLRRKLAAIHHRRPDCTVYDAAGKAIVVIDGETRERRPLP